MRPTSLRALALAGLTAVLLLGPSTSRPAQAQTSYAFPGPTYPFPGPTYPYRGPVTYSYYTYSPLPSWAYYAYPGPAYAYPGPPYLDPGPISTDSRRTILASRRGAPAVRVFTASTRARGPVYLPNTWDDYRD